MSVRKRSQTERCAFCDREIPSDHEVFGFGAKARRGANLKDRRGQIIALHVQALGKTVPAVVTGAGSAAAREGHDLYFMTRLHRCLRRGQPAGRSHTTRTREQGPDGPKREIEGAAARAFDVSAIRREIGYIIERALRLERRVVNLGPLISSRIPAIRGCSIPPMGARVAWRGAGLAIRRGVEDRGARVGIEWTGVYRIDGDAFTYLDPTEGSMMVMGYPTREIEAAASSIMR